MTSTILGRSTVSVTVVHSSFPGFNKRSKVLKNAR